jgi:hypothetical protein
LALRKGSAFGRIADICRVVTANAVSPDSQTKLHPSIRKWDYLVVDWTPNGPLGVIEMTSQRYKNV